MIRLEKSEALQRKIRQDDASELGTPTLVLASEAMRAGRYDQAQELMEYAYNEAKTMHDMIVPVVEELFTYIADTLGEEEVEKTTRQSFYPITKRVVEANSTVEETLQRCVEFQRGHFSDITVTEEPDRYVVKYDPCGAGGNGSRAED